MIEVEVNNGGFDEKLLKINTETFETEVVANNGNVSILDESAVSHYLESMRMPSNNDLYIYQNAVISYPHVVKEGHVFVMGDNRNNSLDSRLLGDVDVRTILGKAYVRILPKPKFGF